MDVTTKGFPVHRWSSAFASGRPSFASLRMTDVMTDVVADVDRSQIADVVREQRLLTAGIGRLVGAQVRDGVVAVGFVDEEDAGLAGAPSAEDHLVPDGLGVEGADDAA